jgi:tyrosine-protein kinase Etk/Wzc
VETERAALQQLVAQAQRSSGAEQPTAGPSPYRRLIAFPTLLRSGVASDLLRSLLSLEDQRTVLLNRRSPNDPEVQALTARIGELEGQLGALVTTYLQGLGSQVASLDATVKSFERQLGRIPENEVQFARYSRQPKVLAETYSLLQMRLKEAEVAQAAEDQSVRLVDAAVLPTRPLGSRKRLIMAGSMIFGLVLGLGLAVAREYADPSVRTRGDVQLALGVPVLGLVPRMGRERGWRQAALELLPRREAASSRAGLPSPGTTLSTAPGTAQIGASRIDREMAAVAADAYDRLHTNILSARAPERLRVVLFTSALPGDGKTTSATNFALTLAQRGLRVILLDADLRRGRVSGLFGVPRAPGLSELLTGAASMEEALHTVTVSGAGRLDFITTGAKPLNPAQLLGSERMSALLARLRDLYDRVVIDTSPLNVVADVIPLGTQADSVIMVARAGVTPVDALIYAAEQLRNAQMSVVGTLLNDIDFERDAGYDGAYRWYAYGKAYYSTVGEQ